MNRVAKRRHRWVRVGLFAVLLAMLGSWAWLERSAQLRERQREIDARQRLQLAPIRVVPPPPALPFRLLASRSGHDAT